MRQLFFLMLMVMASMIANGRQISESEAASIASEFFGSTQGVQDASKSGVHRVVARDAGNADVAPFYVYNAPDNNGFVIVSGDDRAKKILGYSDKGNFDFNNLPVQLSDLLHQYATQIDSIVSNDVHPSWLKSPRKIKNEDGVLLETPNLGQGAPYNALTPEIDGAHAPTGCTATAAAIIMKYHNWPPQGRGYYDPAIDEPVVDDVPRLYGCAPLLPYDFNGTSFDWQSMENDPSRYADVMLAIGRVLATKYYQYESGAYIYPIGPKMHHFFRYSSDCQVLKRDKWDAAEWVTLIKSQLDSGYPIIYFTENIHAFVCDGYNGDDYFHFNFGWDGAENGWYQLDASIPTMDNVIDTGMVINLIPSEDNSDIAVFTDPGYIASPYSYNHWGQVFIIPNELDLSKCYSSRFRIYSPEVFKGEIALSSCNKNEKITKIISTIPVDIEGGTLGINLLMGAVLRFEEFSLEGVSADDDFMLVYRRNGESWQRISGTLEASSLIKNDGYVPKVNIKWDIDPQIKLEYVPESSPKYLSLDMSNEYPEALIKGEQLEFRAKIPENRQAYVYLSAKDQTLISTSIGGYHCEHLYDDYDYMYFPLVTCEDREVTIKLISEANDSLVINDNPPDDSYFDNWPLEDFEPIKHIKISGHVGFWEHVFIGNWAFGLRTLDYSEADYKSDTFLVGTTGYLQYLNELQYPKNTRIIFGCETDNLHNLITFVLPESVQEIDGKLWPSGSDKPRVVVCKALTPPKLNGYVFSYCEGVEESVLLVPKGTKQAYRQADQWNLFKTIIEFEGDWREHVSDKLLVTSISLDETVTFGEEGESFYLGAIVLPDDAANRTIKWTSSDESVATVKEVAKVVGEVSLIKEGTAVITASTTDGSELSAECLIVVLMSGLDDVLTDKSAYVKVFNFNGILVYEGRYSDAHLAPDYYIIVCEGKSAKVKVE